MSSTAVESYTEFDAEENASVLASVFKESGVYLGGAALGKGFRRSARYYLQSIAPKKKSKSSRDANGEIAASVAPVLDRLFPEESGVTLIAEPGRYLVASCATLLVNVTSVRKNILEGKGGGKKGEDDDNVLHPYSDREAAEALNVLTREEEMEIVHGHGSGAAQHPLFRDVMRGIRQVSQRFARQSLAQQEIDVFGDRLDLGEAIDESVAVTDERGLPVPEVLPVDPEEAESMDKAHTAEGVSAFLVDEALVPDEEGSGVDASAEGLSSPGRDRAPSYSSEFEFALAAAGEAAVAGAVLEAVSAVAPASDDYAYYVNDGVYGAFNCIMFDHAVVRPRLLKNPARGGGSSSGGSGSGPGGPNKRDHIVQASLTDDGFQMLDSSSHPSSSDNEDDRGGGTTTTTTNGSKKDLTLYSSTVFGPSCDSIDVVSRSVLLPKLDVGDWLYFNNMGAYTSAAASTFNGFDPSDKFYVCSVRPEIFERMIEGPPEE